MGPGGARRRGDPATPGGHGRAGRSLAGLLLGSCLLLSYGLVLLAVLALAVLAAARRWLPLPVAAASAAVPVLVTAGFGFVLWEAFPVLRERYCAGLASARPTAYWIWGNLAALCLSAGPVLGAALGQLVALGRRADRMVLLLVGGAVTRSPSPTSPA